MDSDRKFDLLGCITYLITSLISLVAGILLSIHWSEEKPIWMKILIWGICLTASGIFGYLLMLAITLPFAHHADKQNRNTDEGK